MPFRQIHRLTSAKLMIFIGYQIIIPLFFSFYQKKLRKSPPPCPRSRKFSSGLQLRAPFLSSSRSSVLTVHNPQPPFCLHFSCPYVSLSICAFWLSHFYSFTPSSLLSCPPIQYAYSCVLLFSPFFLSSFSLCPPVPPHLPLPSKCIKFHFSHHVRYRNTPILLHTIISFMKIYWRFKI